MRTRNSKNLTPMDLIVPIDFPISLLPNEILEVVLTNLSQKDALSLRAVNKFWNAVVDCLYKNWVIRLDENCPCLDWLLDLHIKEVKVARLLKTLKSRVPDSLFKFPDIQKLTIRTEAPRFVLARISLTNIQTLLGAVNPRQLDIHLQAIEEYYDDTTDLCSYFRGFKWPSMHTLRIKLDRVTDELDVRGLGNSLRTLLCENSMPRLTHAQLDFDFNDFVDGLAGCSTVSVAQAVVSFLGLHGPKLKSLLYNRKGFWYFSGQGPRPVLEFEDAKSVQNCCKLERIELHDAEKEMLSPTWIRLLECQKALRQVYASAEIPLIERILGNNFRTLTAIELHPINFEATRRKCFDFGIFQNCTNLRKLKLQTRYTGIRERERISGRNFARLPDSLQFLDLGGIYSKSGDVAHFLATHSNLRALRVEEGRSPISSPCGFNGTCLQLLLKHKALRMVWICSKSINCESPKELRELKKFHRAVDPRGPGSRSFKATYFCDADLKLKRELGSSDPGWKFVEWKYSEAFSGAL